MSALQASLLFRPLPSPTSPRRRLPVPSAPSTSRFRRLGRAPVHFVAVLSLYRDGKYEEALEKFESVFGSKPETSEASIASYNVACCYSKLDRIQAGLSALEDALKAVYEEFKLKDWLNRNVDDKGNIYNIKPPGVIKLDACWWWHKQRTVESERYCQEFKPHSAIYIQYYGQTLPRQVGTEVHGLQRSRRTDPWTEQQRQQPGAEFLNVGKFLHLQDRQKRTQHF